MGVGGAGESGRSVPPFTSFWSRLVMGRAFRLCTLPFRDLRAAVRTGIAFPFPVFKNDYAEDSSGRRIP